MRCGTDSNGYHCKWKNVAYYSPRLCGHCGGCHGISGTVELRRVAARYVLEREEHQPGSMRNFTVAAFKGPPRFDYIWKNSHCGSPDPTCKFLYSPCAIAMLYVGHSGCKYHRKQPQVDVTVTYRPVVVLVSATRTVSENYTSALAVSFTVLIDGCN